MKGIIDEVEWSEYQELKEWKFKTMKSIRDILSDIEVLTTEEIEMELNKIVDPLSCNTCEFYEQDEWCLTAGKPACPSYRKKEVSL